MATDTANGVSCYKKQLNRKPFWFRFRISGRSGVFGSVLIWPGACVAQRDAWRNDPASASWCVRTGVQVTHPNVPGGKAASSSLTRSVRPYPCRLTANSRRLLLTALKSLRHPEQLLLGQEIFWLETRRVNQLRQFQT